MNTESSSAAAPSSTSWAGRVKEALGGHFKPQMTRAVILLAIFEANRTLNKNEQWPSMRPFQRKMAILHAALDLIYTLEFISDEDKARIISMTPKNKENAKPIIARMAFHRAQGLEREVGDKILDGVEKLLVGEGKSHDEICTTFVQNLFEEVTGKSGAHPPLWIFNRRPIFLIYQVYYRGLNMDPKIFEAEALRMVEWPKAKPACLAAHVFGTWSPVNTEVLNIALDDGKANAQEDDFVGDVMVDDDNEMHKEQNRRGISKMNRNQRLQYLMELKLRLDLLNEVGGDGFDEEKMKAEKMNIFHALSTIDSSSCKNRQALMMETKIRLDILKDLKKSNINTNRCIQMMKDMYIGLPPLMTDGGGVSPIGRCVNRKKAERTAKKAARIANREARKKPATGTFVNADTTVGKSLEDEWEVLDAMEEVNDSISDMKV